MLNLAHWPALAARDPDHEASEGPWAPKGKGAGGIRAPLPPPRGWGVEWASMVRYTGARRFAVGLLLRSNPVRVPSISWSPHSPVSRRLIASA